MSGNQHEVLNIGIHNNTISKWMNMCDTAQYKTLHKAVMLWQWGNNIWVTMTGHAPLWRPSGGWAEHWQAVPRRHQIRAATTCCIVVFQTIPSVVCPLSRYLGTLQQFAKQAVRFKMWLCWGCRVFDERATVCLIFFKVKCNIIRGNVALVSKNIDLWTWGGYPINS